MPLLRFFPQSGGASSGAYPSEYLASFVACISQAESTNSHPNTSNRPSTAGEGPAAMFCSGDNACPPHDAPSHHPLLSGEVFNMPWDMEQLGGKSSSQSGVQKSSQGESIPAYTNNDTQVRPAQVP